MKTLATCILETQSCSWPEGVILELKLSWENGLTALLVNVSELLRGRARSQLMLVICG